MPAYGAIPRRPATQIYKDGRYYSSHEAAARGPKPEPRRMRIRRRAQLNEVRTLLGVTTSDYRAQRDAVRRYDP